MSERRTSLGRLICHSYFGHNKLEWPFFNLFRAGGHMLCSMSRTGFPEDVRFSGRVTFTWLCLLLFRSLGPNIDFDLVKQLNQLRFPEPPLLPEALDATGQPGGAQPPVDDHREPDKGRPGRQSLARLLARGTARVAQKLGEEATSV
jgi:hypothetical protein